MRLLLLTCSACFVMVDVMAATITINCPAKFPAEQITFSGTPAGWTPYTRSALEVTTADLMHGPPSSYEYAVPSKYRDEKRRVVATWGVTPGPGMKKWLQCGYGAAAELSLSQPLPESTSECTVIKHKDAQGNVTKVEAICQLE